VVLPHYIGLSLEFHRQRTMKYVKRTKVTYALSCSQCLSYGGDNGGRNWTILCYDPPFGRNTVGRPHGLTFVWQLYIYIYGYSVGDQRTFPRPDSRCMFCCNDSETCFAVLSAIWTSVACNVEGKWFWFSEQDKQMRVDLCFALQTASCSPSFSTFLKEIKIG
jgi:hypothetical protein